MKISFYGKEGSFHHIAAQNYFSKTKNVFVSQKSFESLFASVQNKKTDYGIIAIENSIAGSILENYDLFSEYEVVISGEIYLRISHHLIGHEDTNISEIQTVYSHSMAIKQCKNFLKKYPHWKIYTTKDTSESIADVSQKNDKTKVAIGNKLSAKIHAMKLLQENIETHHNNFTRFFIITHKDTRSLNTPHSHSKKFKTSLTFEVSHTPGSLGKVFEVCSKHAINVSKIESRPIIGTKWHYYFYLDVEASEAELKTKSFFPDLEKHVQWYKILGSYVQGDVFES